MTDAELTALIVKLQKLYQAYGHGESYQNLLRDFQNPTDDGFRERWQFVKFSGMGGLDDEYLPTNRLGKVEFYLLAAELFDELICRGIRPPESAKVSKQLREMAELYRQRNPQFDRDQLWVLGQKKLTTLAINLKFTIISRSSFTLSSLGFPSQKRGHKP